jgi:hypothetical protein
MCREYKLPFIVGIVEVLRDCPGNGPLDIISMIDVVSGRHWPGKQLIPNGFFD